MASLQDGNILNFDELMCLCGRRELAEVSWLGWAEADSRLGNLTL